LTGAVVVGAFAVIDVRSRDVVDPLFDLVFLFLELLVDLDLDQVERRVLAVGHEVL
jgi:hypothetical protein